MTTNPGEGLGSARAVRLIAGRELRTRLRSKAFRISTLALVVLVVAFAFVMHSVTSGSSAEQVGVVPSANGLARQVQATAAALGQDIQTVPVHDEAAGRQRLKDGELDALVLGTDGPRLRVVVDKKLGDNLRTVLTAAAGQSVLDGQITRLGGNPSVVARNVGQASVQVTSLHPAPTFNPQRLAVGSVAGVLIYLALMFTGQSVAQGVVEEKSSRVVELLLSTIRPWQLMAGKVVGIGLVGLLQVCAVGIAGALAGRLSGSLTISLSATIGSVLWLIVWFILGFTLYALIFAGLAALVSRQEDIGGVIMPPVMFLIVGYVIGISVLPNAPDSPVVSVMSLVPLFSPTLMPMRLAMGAVPLWQTVLSVALVLATIPALVALAGRMYRNAVIRTGGRVRLAEALQGK
jgi:ABC-2 type transport system permease protein